MLSSAQFVPFRVRQLIRPFAPAGERLAVGKVLGALKETLRREKGLKCRLSGTRSGIFCGI